MKFILFVTQEIVLVEVINNLLIDDSPKEFADNFKKVDGPVL